MMTNQEDEAAEQTCPNREDDMHCIHWWDGEPCCACGAPAMTEDEKAGMIE